MALVYNVNNSATNVLASKQIKENIFVDLIHRNGKGVNQVEETNVSTVRMLKVSSIDGDARQLGSGTNGAFVNTAKATIPDVPEYDLNLLYVFDKMADLPELQADLVPADVFGQTMKNIGGRVATEINASTIAHQLVAKYNAAKAAGKWDGNAVVLGSTPKYYEAIQDASAMLDDGDIENGIQSFPFEEREIIMRPSFRAKLMTNSGILVGGSNFAQSMIAKGGLSPDARKEFGSMYVGEIDLIPCYSAPVALWNRAGEWVGSADAFKGAQAIVCAASATDRGISTQDYVKTIPSPDTAGVRLQPKTRWGVNVCYPKGIIPILANGTAAPSTDLTVVAPGSRA
jgi:hypothetical protein